MQIRAVLTYGDGPDITVVLDHTTKTNWTPWGDSQHTYFGMSRDVARKLAMDLLNLVDKYDTDMNHLKSITISNFEQRLIKLEGEF